MAAFNQVLSRESKEGRDPGPRLREVPSIFGEMGNHAAPEGSLKSIPLGEGCWPEGEWVSLATSCTLISLRTTWQSTPERSRSLNQPGQAG